MSWVRIAASVSFVFLALISSAMGREWKDATGKISRAGDFVAYRDGRVVVRLADGRETQTALEQFSAADQAYVRDLVKAKADPAVVPAKLASQTVQARTANYESAAPPATSLAQTPTAPRAEAPAAESNERDTRIAGKSHDKYVFYADCGTFHIILFETGVGQIIGTAHYAMPYWWPPCGCCCCCCPCTGPWYLSFLEKNKLTTNGILYAYDIGTSNVIEWRFDINPGSHPIRYRTNSGWHFFGYSSWVHPK